MQLRMSYGTGELQQMPLSTVLLSPYGTEGEAKRLVDQVFPGRRIRNWYR